MTGTIRAADAALEAIAVIGMSGRWPGARDVDEFWSNLCGGVESIRPFSEAELSAAGFDPAVLQHPGFVNAGAPIDDPDLFDAAFFGVTPREAQSLDPQRRVFLECAWHALEDAGQVPENVDGPIGIFAGSSLSGYLHRVHANPELVAAVGAYQTIIGNDKDHLTTYTAYKLNLTGPAVTVQTACSTSLVAAAMSCQSLLNHECDLALAGGVSVRLPQHVGYFYEKDGILSPDGHCRPFDAAGRGTVTGNGVGVVVLKRLADAVRDRDPIRAVILGAAINNDGALKVGYTAPSVTGQAAVIATALALSGISPEALGYIEAHGTATPLGDPIEIAGLTQALAPIARRNFCAIGSVKSNIGHLDAAAGVSGLMKAVLCVEHGLIPPSLHFTQPNPSIDFANSPVYVPTRLTEWPAAASPRHAAVSSFGIGGTNAHVILTEPPQRNISDLARPAQLLVLSARSDTALQQVASHLAADLRESRARPLADVAFTLALGRRGFNHRRFVVCSDVDQAIKALENPSATSTKIAAASEVVFLFPGQGSQRAGMGRELYAHERVFREHVDRCATLLQPHLGVDIRHALFAPDGSEARVRATALAQPALFTVEYALARVLMSWGIVPAAMMGHSLGEYVAACLASVFSLEDALGLVALRGRLMQETSPGAMLATSLAEEQARSLESGGVSVASVNGPAQTVLSGPEAEIRELERGLRARNVACIRLNTSHAFHSVTMDAVLDRFRDHLAHVELRPPAIPYIANRTGTWQTASATDPAYWIDHLRHSVRFADGCRELTKRDSTFVEVGPGDVLTTLLQPWLRGDSASAAVTCELDPRAVARAVGTVWSRGAAVDWTKYYAGERRNRVRLPLYPFERQRYDALAPSASTKPAAQKHPDLASWFYLPSWRQTRPPATPPSRGSYLVFVDGTGLGNAVVRQLRDRDRPVITVEPGESFDCLDAYRFRIRAEEPADYNALRQTLAADGAFPDHVLHLWNAGNAPPHAKRDSFFSLLYLAQMLGHRTEPIHVSVVSSHVHSVTGSEPIDALKATILGVSRVAPHEHPNLRWQNVDVDSWGAEAAAQILAEIASGSTEAVVAYRAGRRWVETIEPAPLPAPASSTSLLVPRGVYLITGGLGGIGLAIAQHLAQTLRARLVLVGRTPLRDDSPARAAVVAMERAGAEILVRAADVADAAQMRDVLIHTKTRFGPLNGVIHAAGVAGGGMIQLKSRDVAAAVLAPKVTGARTLAALLQDANLDFVVFFSSLTSLLGGFGQVDYCAANAFLDALAYQTIGGAQRTITIDWDAWSEVGMAVSTVLPREMETHRAEVLKNAIRPQEGAEAFVRALHAGLPRICVSTVHLPSRIEQARALIGATVDVSPSRPPVRRPRPEVTSEFVPARSEIEKQVAEMWSDLLGLSDIGVNDNFFELGGHSLLATQLASRIRAWLNLDVTVRHILEAPTIAGLGESLETMLLESEELIRTIDEVEQMTDAQVRSRLERQT